VLPSEGGSVAEAVPAVSGAQTGRTEVMLAAAPVLREQRAQLVEAVRRAARTTPFRACKKLVLFQFLFKNGIFSPG
jgi:hypothetical protein